VEEAPKPLLDERRGPIRLLTLNRPAQRNALSPELIGRLRAALAEADADEATHVVCVTGAGDRAFCAGADLTSVAGGSTLVAHEARRAYAGLLLDLGHLGKPVVACINGAAVAGALGLIAACDFAIACEEAHFSLPEIDVGLFPYMALAPLVRVLGRRRALDLALTGRRVDAQEALHIGLVNEVHPRAQLWVRTETLCRTLAGKSSAVLRLGRRAFYAMQDLPYEAQLEAMALHLDLNAGLEDAREGVSAFLARRKPEWRGR
jgi:enoyl-CoA hydratase/carnithine racemase